MPNAPTIPVNDPGIPAMTNSMMQSMHRKVGVALSVVLVLAMATMNRAAASDTGTVQSSGKPDFLWSGADTSVSPAVDFFQYVNGGWLKRNPVPPSEPSWGIENEVQEQVYQKLLKINQTAASTGSPDGTDLQKIGDFWTAAMDTRTADAQGIHPLDAEIGRIHKISTVQDAIDTAFRLREIEVRTFFDIGVAQDETASDVMAIHVSQGGLGLPDRDFYVNPDRDIAAIRTAYVSHLARLLQLCGVSARVARHSAAQVMDFETALAKASRKLEDLNDPLANYHKLAVAEFTMHHTPSIHWNDYLARWQLHADTLIVGQPEYFSSLQNQLENTPVSVLRNYLLLRLVNDYSTYLSRAFDNESFRFTGQVLNGQQQQRPRWKRVLDVQDAAMGMLTGRLYVRENFPDAVKQRYVKLVESIRSAYLERINQLDWMSEPTKVMARKKLAAINAKVGYPDRWQEYTGLTVGRVSYATNMLNANRWRFRDMLDHYGRPVDRTEWSMTPQTFNAYYSPSNNEIVMPAVIFMIPGVDDEAIDDAVAYGYSGATIGHEITHGFDDSGRLYDAAGNLSDWWNEDDARQYAERADLIIRQFNAYEPVSGLHINGRATEGENIADHGGLLLAIGAFRTTQQFKQGNLLGGLTPMQRFFMGAALSNRSQAREAALRTALLSDVHSPAKWRVIGPMSVISDFHEAFNVKPGQPMYRPKPDQVNIW